MVGWFFGLEEVGYELVGDMCVGFVVEIWVWLWGIVYDEVEDV